MATQWRGAGLNLALALLLALALALALALPPPLAWSGTKLLWSYTTTCRIWLSAVTTSEPLSPHVGAVELKRVCMCT